MIIYNRMVIIGVGLIGGSLAIACKERGLVKEIIGLGRGIENLKKAKEIGVIDGYIKDPGEAVSNADIVILATPVGALEEMAIIISPYLKKGTIVTDVGSVKGGLVERIEGIFSDEIRFIGGHPIAGRERSGVEASSGDLFKGTRCILTPTNRANTEAIEKVKDLWEEVGASVIFMDPIIHDKIMAGVSHLPHIVAYSLVNTLLDIKIGEDNIITFSAGGFRDFTRISASSPEMWRDISLLNRENLIKMIDRYQDVLDRLKQMIVDRDGEGLMEEFKRSREVRKDL